jgi:YesN/AraC family two-component response regulator
MRILIADDHGIVRGGMKLLIDRQPDMEVVAEAGDGVEAFEKALASKPDLCVMDVSMPRMTGLQAARQIRGCATTHPGRRSRSRRASRRCSS